MGLGHVMRCLALAEAWQADGGRTLFVSACGNGTQQRIRESGSVLVPLGQAYPGPEDVGTTKECLAQAPGSVLVLDGYQFDGAYQKAVRVSGHPLAVIDDFAGVDHYVADVIVNPNLGADKLDYSCESYTRLLLGTAYVPLRPEFNRWRAWDRHFVHPARRLLVTLGGTDPDNVTRMALDALARPDMACLEATVVVDGANPRLAELRQAAEACAASVRVACDVRDMAELMAWADVAVSGGGTTCWEMAFMGLPNGIIVLSDNQRVNAEVLDTAGVSVRIGSVCEVTADAIHDCVEKLVDDEGMCREMSIRGRTLVDGQGTRRVLAALKELGKPNGVES